MALMKTVDGAVGPMMSSCEMGGTLMRSLARWAMLSSEIYHAFNGNICAGTSHPVSSIAIGADSAPIVKYLLERGANPNDNYYLDESPLEWARTKKPENPEIIQSLLDHGAKK
jgi:hypothetical protein